MTAAFEQCADVACKRALLHWLDGTPLNATPHDDKWAAASTAEYKCATTLNGTWTDTECCIEHTTFGVVCEKSKHRSTRYFITLLYREPL
jgi:hypothetical protein